MSGARSYHGGLAAEEIVLGHYLARGHALRARRWRGRAGEIDLILASADGYVFVEVKSSATHARALGSLSSRQIGRIATAAAEYMALHPGAPHDGARVDLAVVDARGVVEVVENITG